MKKILCLFLVGALLLLLCPVMASADEMGKVSFSGVPDQPIRGMRFSAVLELNRNPGLVYLCTTVTFDTAVLEVVDVKDLGLLPSFVMVNRASQGKIELQWKNEKNEDLVTSGKLAQINFRIRDDAPYGKSILTPQVSQRYIDARNAEGKIVEFESQASELFLDCLHSNTETQVLTPPTFDAEGLGEVHCTDCDERFERVLYPSVTSADGRTSVFVEKGQFSEGDKKEVRTDFLYGGADAEKARALFGDALVRSFRVSITKNGGNFHPAGKTRVELFVEFDLPQDFALYALGEETKKADCEFHNGKITFDYQNASFVLVSREVKIPASTPTVTTAAPTTFSMPDETSPEPSENKDALYLGVGIAAFVVFGALCGILLRGGKKTIDEN
jgi:hypothetical protein